MPMPTAVAPPAARADVATCPVCNAADSSAWATMLGYGMQRCNECAHVFVAPAVPEEVLAKAYEEDYYKRSGSSDATGNVGYDDYMRTAQTRLRGFNQRLTELEPFTGPPGRLLDFGCAVGLFVRAARDRGWEAVGYDRSEWAARYGREHLGVTIHTEVPPRFKDGSFDLVTLWDCIEHLPDPRSIVESVRTWLRPGGVIALNTVNSSSVGARLAGRAWRHVAPPVHLHLFSSRSLRRLLSESGFAVAHSHGEGIVLGAQKGRVQGRVMRAADDLLCHWRLRALATTLNLRDEQLIIARRIN